MEPQKERALTILEELCREQCLTDFVTFGSVWEGVVLPGNVEERSGLILSRDGKVYSYWLGWDPNRTAPDGSKGYYTLGDGFGEVSREQYESDIRYFEELRSLGVVGRFG